MKKKNKRVRRLGRKVNNLVILLMAVSISMMVMLCVGMFYKQTMRMLENRCVNGTNMLAYLMENHKPENPEDITQMLDDLKEEMRCEFTIFEGDVRAYTTVEQRGERLTGTTLSEDLSEIVLEQGKTYVGKAEILGDHYLCSYVPTKDNLGNATGLIFAGVSMEAAYEQINLTIKLSCPVPQG